MRSPSTKNDKSLLEEEPFRTEFLKRRLQGTEQRTFNWTKYFTSIFMNDFACLPALQRWMELACKSFYSTEPTDLQLRPEQLARDRAAWAVFIDYYWLLYERDEDQAEVVLNKFIKARREQFDPRHNAPKGRAQVRVTADAPPSNNSVAKKKRRKKKKSYLRSHTQVDAFGDTASTLTVEPLHVDDKKEGRIDITGNRGQAKESCVPPGDEQRRAEKTQFANKRRRRKTDASNGLPPTKKRNVMSPADSSDFAASALDGKTPGKAKRLPHIVSQDEEKLLNAAVAVLTPERADRPDLPKNPDTGTSAATPTDLGRNVTPAVVEALGSMASHSVTLFGLPLSSSPSMIATFNIPSAIHAVTANPTELKPNESKRAVRSDGPRFSSTPKKSKRHRTAELTESLDKTDLHTPSGLDASGDTLSYFEEPTHTGGVSPLGFDQGIRWKTPMINAMFPEDWGVDDDWDCKTADNASICDVTAQPYVEEVNLAKPPLPHGIRPVIWAQTRQAVCESLPWFRSYQGGVYASNGSARGYLLSAFSAARDLFHHDGKLIISHGGGKSITPNMSGGQKDKVIAENQTETDLSVRSLLRTHKSQIPIVLIADDKYRLFPYNLGKHTYVVLGYYWITHAWAEQAFSNNENGTCVKYKFAFQWCESQGMPWWLSNTPANANSSTAHSNITSTVNAPRRGKFEVGATAFRLKRRTPVLLSSTERDSKFTQYPIHLDRTQCFTCNAISPAVYTIGWTCLRPHCSRFWDFDFEPSDAELLYSSKFLELQDMPSSFNVLEDLRPLPALSAKDGVTTTKEFIKGWWCPICGQLNCREKWECWECTNCKNTLEVKGRLRIPKEFWYQQHNLDFMHHSIHRDSGIAFRLQQWRHSTGAGLLLTYVLPFACGRIHLVAGNATVNCKADDLFELYQKEAASSPLFRRYPLATHTLRGRMLSNYFSQNSGAPYKYVANCGDTTPWETAPLAVKGARQLLKDRVASVLGKDVEFNEVLSAAYMERQKMSFHTDSEPGLGPIVSSLSLGSVALMHFRLHARSAHASRDGQHRRDLSLVLRHGDIVIMEGTQIQTDYEHTVVPKNFRIAATARFISPTGVLPESQLSHSNVIMQQ